MERVEAMGGDRAACRQAQARLHAPERGGLEAYCGPIPGSLCSPEQAAEWSASLPRQAACTRARASYMIAMDCVAIVNAIGGSCGVDAAPGDDWRLESARRFAGARAKACEAARSRLCAGLD